MKKIILTLMPFIACSLVFAEKNYTVSNAKELLKAIGPNRTITLDSGNYNLKDAYDIRSKYVSFVDQYDGPELNISNVTDMTLTANGKVTILAEPRYAWVINFKSCKGIDLTGMVFGHTVAGGCMGGVLGFDDCAVCRIINCEMFGSGTEGMALKSSSNMTFQNCLVRNCTDDLMHISSSYGVLFFKCTFKDTGGYDLIEIKTSHNIFYKWCMFSNNATSEYMPYFFNIDEVSKNINVEESIFKDNKATKFINDNSRLIQSDNKFEGNAF